MGKMPVPLVLRACLGIEIAINCPKGTKLSQHQSIKHPILIIYNRSENRPPIYFWDIRLLHSPGLVNGNGSGLPVPLRGCSFSSFSSLRSFLKAFGSSRCRRLASSIACLWYLILYAIILLASSNPQESHHRVIQM